MNCCEKWKEDYNYVPLSYQNYCPECGKKLESEWCEGTLGKALFDKIHSGFVRFFNSDEVEDEKETTRRILGIVEDYRKTQVLKPKKELPEKITGYEYAKQTDNLNEKYNDLETETYNLAKKVNEIIDYLET